VQVVYPEKLTGVLEQSTVKDEQVIFPYSSDLLKLSQYLWSLSLLAELSKEGSYVP